MRRLHLEDISKQLGYSKTLISMVLNGKGNQYGISKKTQAKVLETITKLNYSPNKFARSLRTGRSFFIALIVSDISNSFYAKIAKSIEEELSQKGYQLMICSMDENPEKEKELVDMLTNQQGVDGLIIASAQMDNEFYNHPRFIDLPLLFIDRVIPNHKANYVVVDNYGGSLEIVNSLIKGGGYRKLACFAITPIKISTIEDRLSGFIMACSKAGIEKKDAVICEVSFDNTYEDIERSLREFIVTDSIPEAIYALNNQVTLCILKAFKKSEFAALRDIKLASFDDLDVFNIIDKQVLAVSQPLEEIGKSSSLLILDIIAGKQLGNSNIVLSPELINR
jgi:LacI family transcriptional regulator